jgi:serine-type D-Ala-D-Ala carboxypeptidase/endopeptidase
MRRVTVDSFSRDHRAPQACRASPGITGACDDSYTPLPVRLSTGTRVRLGLVVISTSLAIPAAAQTAFPPEAVIREAARSFLPFGEPIGIVVGILDAHGTRRVVAVGNPRFDGRTIFEIGSVTKVFTGTLLAEMAERGEVRLDEPVAALLPDGNRVPVRSHRPITLLDLATHSSGLPREPDNFRGTAVAFQYADYSVDRLSEFLRAHELRRDAGTKYEYSNLGVGLLGHALAVRAKTGYEALLRARILAPLAMSSTAITLDDSLKARLAPGYSIEMNVLAGAGALKSSADDLLTFLAANLQPPDTPLGRAIARSHQSHFSRDAVRQVGLSWDLDRVFGERLIRHGGQTLGYRGFVGFNADRRIAVVALTNSRTDLGPMLTHLLVPHLPLTSRARAMGFLFVVLALNGLLIKGVETTWKRKDSGKPWLVGYATAAVTLGWIMFLQYRVPSADTVSPYGAPGKLLLIGAPVLTFVIVGLSRVGARLAQLPLPLLIGVQSVRAILAMLMHRTYAHSTLPIPAALVWNLEVAIGIASLVLAVLVVTKRVGSAVVAAWNWTSGILLLNLLVIAWRNPWATQTSFTALPAFIVPVALLAHIVVSRKLREGR